MLISVEGIDGSGKSTLIKNITATLQDLQLPLVVTKEPGGTALGKQLRTLLQERTFTIYPKAEYLLFAADRAQHFEQLIIPALQANTIILSDRMADSSLVYQGYGRGLDMNMLQTINHWAMHGYTPDVTLYVKIPPTVAYERLAQRKNLSVFDKEKEDFFVTITRGFDTLFKTRTNVIHLDGLQQPDTLTEHATKAILEWLTTHDAIL